MLRINIYNVNEINAYKPIVFLFSYTYLLLNDADII